MEDMSTKKLIPHYLLGLALFAVAVLGISMSPQKAYAVSCPAAGCPFLDLRSLIPQLPEELKGYTATLDGMMLNATDSAPTRGLIDNAKAQVQNAISTMPKSYDSAWVALANKAVTAY